MKKNKKSKQLRAQARAAQKKKAGVLRRKLWLLVLNFFLLFSLYQVFLHFEWIWGTGLYIVAAAALAIAYFVINRGFGKPATDGDALPREWSAVQKCAYIEDAKRRYDRAAYLLLWLLPLIGTILFDVVNLFLLTPLRAALKL